MIQRQAHLESRSDTSNVLDLSCLLMFDDDDEPFSLLFDLVQSFSILFDQSFLVAVDNENNVVIYPDTKLAQTVLAEKYSSLYIRAYNADVAHNRYV